MIRLGVCTKYDNMETLARIGFDYIEGNLNALAAMSQEDYEALCSKVDAMSIRVEAFNGMLPAHIHVTGPDVNAKEIHDYLDAAFARAKRLGGEVIVFGSSASRNVPDGFEMEVAWRQIGNFLRMAQRHAQDYDLYVAIEPLRRHETNIINFVSEAVLMAAMLQLPRVAALGDTYHMAMVAEPVSTLSRAGKMLRHVHTANALGRTFPRERDGENYGAIFAALREGSYEGRVSIEGKCDEEQFEEEARRAFMVLDQARQGKSENLTL